MECVKAVLLTVIAASTPLLLAAAGELVVERAGVLNLGVEGMMIVGAACGFAGAYHTGSIAIGALCGILGGKARRSRSSLCGRRPASRQPRPRPALLRRGV